MIIQTIFHKEETRYTLGSASIDEVSEALQELLSSIGTEKREIIRIRLLTEELLLNWQEKFGEEAEFTLSAGRRFGQYQITLTLRGDPCNPLTGDEEKGNWYGRLTAELGLAPSWSYDNGTNCVIFRRKKRKPSTLKGLMLAVLLAAAVTALGFLLPDEFRAEAVEKILDPLCETFLGLLETAALPLVFLSIADGIYGIGDAAAFGSLGKRMTLRFLTSTTLFTLIAALAILPLFRLNRAGTGGTLEISSVLAMLLDMLPKNLLLPFTEGHPMQVVILAVGAGMALLVLGRQTEGIARLVGQANSLFICVMEWLDGLVSAFVFLVLVRLGWSKALGAMAGAWKPVAIYFAACALLLTGALLWSAKRSGLPVKTLMKKLLPVFLTALSSASSTAAHSVSFECAEKELGVDKGLVKVGVPIGFILCIPGEPLNYLVLVFFFAEYYQTDCSAAWVVMVVLLCLILGFATPPVPGGTLASFTLLFAQTGIPAAAVGMSLAVAMLFDFIGTALNVTFLQLELLRLAHRFHLLDERRLRV